LQHQTSLWHLSQPNPPSVPEKERMTEEYKKLGP